MTSAIYEVKCSPLTVNLEQSKTFKLPSRNASATSFNLASVPLTGAFCPSGDKATEPLYKVELTQEEYELVTDLFKALDKVKEKNDEK